MLICNFCGEIFENYPTYKQSHGNSYAEEVVNENCPCCNRGELVEAEECPLCYEWTEKEKMQNTGGVCEDCLDGYAVPKYAVEYGEHNREKVAINGFIKFALTEEEINSALMTYLRKNTKKFADKARPYCLEDKQSFGEYILNAEK